MAFLRRLFTGPTEEELLVERVNAATPDLPDSLPSHVGWFRTIKKATMLEDAKHFGRRYEPASIELLVAHVETMPGLGDAHDILGRGISYMGTIRELGSFEIDALVVAMGESVTDDGPTPLGSLTIKLLSQAPYLGGTQNAQIMSELAEADLRDRKSTEKMLAWTALALARLDIAGEIPTNSRMPFWHLL